ncbi:MAG: ABC transporter ATP-binding protein [Arachnia propionica]|uniref:ABC transporter ATP-binding protein n=1 Tax=Arachnia propionica TaxID=1750 RepID=UPI0026F6CABE|nr:ABC transporter ATP-binding protein [Arachnia propionica]
MNTLIQVRGLTKRFGPVNALDSLDLELTGGRIVGLLGENGCGKTTLLKVLAGVMQDHEGEVRVCGTVPGPESKAKVSFLPDASYLTLKHSLEQHIGLYADFFPDFLPDKARESAGFFGLDVRMRLKNMSKGMREKAQIALAMSREAKVFLLDEPISGVDPAAREIILEGIVRGLADDAMVLISTHLIHDLEPILDAVVMMRAGKVLLSGEVDDLRATHGLSIDALFRKAYSWSAH